jgi:hypothetical protein
VWGYLYDPDILFFAKYEKHLLLLFLEKGGGGDLK